MSKYETPQEALTAVQAVLLAEGKKTPRQIVEGFVKSEVLAPAIATSLLQLTEFLEMEQQFDIVKASKAWEVVAARSYR